MIEHGFRDFVMLNLKRCLGDERSLMHPVLEDLGSASEALIAAV